MQTDTTLAGGGLVPSPPPDPPSDPVAVAASVESLYRQLAAAPSLRPGRHVDALFRDLVHLAVATPDPLAAAVMADPAVQALRPHLVELCAGGEHQLEVAWSRHIGASRLADVALARFPYLDNYRQLTDLELATVAANADRPIERALFVGAGPLPLSALHLSERLAVPVDGLDRDRAAVDAARRVADRLGAGARIAFHHGDLHDLHDLTRYDLVVLAALVGLTRLQKRRSLGHLRRAMAPGALLLARSAHRLRTLLYPTVDPIALRHDGWDVLAVTHPTGPVINSAVLARKPR